MFVQQNIYGASTRCDALCWVLDPVSLHWEGQLREREENKAMISMFAISGLGNGEPPSGESGEPILCVFWAKCNVWYIK